MEKLLTFLGENDEKLFSALADVLPRPGDEVSFSLEARDREQWNDEAWADNAEVSGKQWRVLRVHHEFRRMSIESTAHVVFVYVTPNVRVEAPLTALRKDEDGTD